MKTNPIRAGNASERMPHIRSGRTPAVSLAMQLLTATLLLSSAGTAQTITASGLYTGSSFVLSQRGDAATRAGMFTGNFYQPGGTGGQVIANVNTFTGQPSYTVPLYTLSARGEVSFPFALNFSGPTFPTVENNNDKAPAGWLGVGWSMSMPFVAVNHKGTRAYSDDVIMCNLGPYGGGQILLQPETGRYYVATAPSIVVSRDTVSDAGSPLYRQVKSWTFTIPATGVRLVFGHAGADTVHNSERHLRYAGGMIIASPYNIAASKPFIYRWDLRRMEDAVRKSGLDFDYQKFQEALWSDSSYTRESYLKKVTWKDEYGNEIQRVELGLDNLQAGEYFGYFPGEAKTSQKLYETKRLKDLTVFHEGRQHVKYLLRRNVKELQYGKKGVLDSVIPLFGPGERRGSAWAFTYRDGDQLLADIIPPSGVKERFEYQTLDLGATLGAQEGLRAFRDTTGAVVYPTHNGDGWRVEARCDDRFCYEIVRNDRPSPHEVHLRVTLNTGNYFDTTRPVLQRKLKREDTHVDEWQIVPAGDYILIANTEKATLELWEWDGDRFQLRNDSVGNAGDPIQSHFGYGGGVYSNITVFPGGPNYFLVYRNEDPGSLPRRIWVYLKDPVTGKWSNLTQGTRSSAGCKFQNYRKPNDGGWRDPASTKDDSCFNWDDPVLIAAGDRMFAVRVQQEDILYMYALNPQGTGFDSIGQLIPQFSDGVQETSGGQPSPQNWNYDIHDMRMGPDFLMIKSANQDGDRSRYDFLFHDGSTVKRIGVLGWEDDDLTQHYNASAGTRHDRNVWLGGNYFIHANTKPSATNRLEYWRKRQNGDSIFFEKTKTFRTDVPHEEYADVRVALGSRFFSVEYFPFKTFDMGMDPQDYPFTDGSGNIKSWLYRINDTAGVDSVPAAAYTLPYGGCNRKVWNMSFSGIDNVMLATLHKNSSGCGNCGANCLVKNVSFKTNLLTNSFEQDSILDPINSISHQTKMRDRSWSLGDRLGMSMFIKYVGSPDTLWIRRYIYNGRSYGENLAADVVRRFVRHATPDSLYPPLVTEFDFGIDTPGVVTEFNHNALTPQFEYARVSQRGLRGGTVFDQYLDHQGRKLVLDSASLNGRPRRVHTFNAAGDTIAEQFSLVSPAYSRGWSAPGVRDYGVVDPWPQGVAVNRDTMAQTRQWADGGSFRTTIVRHRVYSDTLEAPLFTIVDQGDRVTISQTMVDSTGYRIKSRLAYDYPDSGAFTESWFAARRADTLPSDAAKGLYAIAHSGVTYESAFPYKVKQVIGWRDPGGSWSDEELKAGPVPDYEPGENTFVASEVSRRDSLGQVLESFADDGELRSFTTVFHEGRAALPVGVIHGARRDNAAVLTAENGSVPQLLALGKLDRDKLWDAPGVTYDSLKARTGRYSFKVTDHFGPSGNLYLKDVHDPASGGFGFVASAWILGDMDGAPVFSVSRRHANNSVQDEVYAAPVEGTYVRGKWQRWEVRLSNAQLVASGMFASDAAGDYLRFFIGTGSPSSTPSKVIYVDDIVLRPDNALFSLTAYNERGQVTHSTDTHHRTVTTEYGHAGQPVATRDERGRIFSQQGFNKPGENQ